MAQTQVEAVVETGVVLRDLLRQSAEAKRSNTIEPALTKAFLGDYTTRISNVRGIASAQYAIVDAAIRDVFNGLLASESIDEPGFVQMWNLLDVCSILSDSGDCEPAQLFWLVEELLDSQTIAGCRRVFDYLESRRERIMAENFTSKKLVILRTCNELLRRLSRAEDTAFCGRVFIFLFQSFPLHDKSAVNLRGEYHVDNVTTFDDLPSKEADSEAMDVDAESRGAPPASLKSTTKSVTFDAQKAADSSAPVPAQPDELYPIFWNLQQSFSQPKKLFEVAHFDAFKKGIESTMLTFDSVQREQMTRGAAKLADESKRGTRGVRAASGDLGNAFNPKYLTSRDLFELEISDVSFRRHIAVQAMIVLDFMLSLSPKSKEKQALASTQNKSVMYQDQVLGEEDYEWATKMKDTIAQYLSKGVEGPFFLRMVQTVLSRDKNWVRWKIESCPAIERLPASSEDFNKARAAAKKTSTNKRLRPHPQASLDLKFLASGADIETGMERLKRPRYNVPALVDFQKSIADDDFEIEMPTNEDSKIRSITSKASKSWRALRMASRHKLTIFDKIDDPERIDIIFKEDVSEPIVENSNDVMDEDVTLPDDKRPVIISGSRNSDASNIVKEFLEKNSKIFTKSISHTTRAARAGETAGIDYHFVTKEQFNIMRDGDQYLEFRSSGEEDYGIARKSIESVIASGKIPVTETDDAGVQQFKDNAYTARYILLAANAEEAAKNVADGLFEHAIIHEKMETTIAALERYILGSESVAVSTDAVEAEEGTPRSTTENAAVPALSM